MTQENSIEQNLEQIREELEKDIPKKEKNNEKKEANLVDQFLNKFITRFLTKDEWHTAVLGFFDGLSFEMKGKWHRKAFSKTSVSVEGIDVEKSWYYRVPYVIGEFTKIGIALMLVDMYGPEILFTVL
ncbi:hypothetical protein OSG_eHP35_00210 [environmental Halophage eHP-35]|nr:hypothetical protein OSG_eHP35_00210 [environmental Halophage eHP-35]